MPGPKPTPTAKLAQRGSWRAKTRSEEPQPEISPELADPGLEGRAQEIWDRLAPQLHAAGILTDVDVPGLIRYCRLYAAWEEAMAAVEENSDRSAILSLAKLDEMVRKLEANFGLSPADRTGIKVPDPKPDGKSRFFERAS